MSNSSFLRGFLPPVLLVAALAMVFTAFGMLAFGQPEESTQLIEARSLGDDQTAEMQEAQLQRQRIKRTVVITCLFAGGAVSVWLAFSIMHGPAG